jgi:hypothetical protein
VVSSTSQLNARSDITVEYTDARYKLLKPCKVSKDELKQSTITEDEADLFNWLSLRSGTIAYDTETNGLLVFGNPDFRVVGLGFADHSSGIYLDVADKSKEHITKIMKMIRDVAVSRNIKFICHNLFYDLSVTSFYLGNPRYDENTFPWEACTHILFRTLASEGFFGQSWGLKTAQTTFLLWEDTNEKERDEWLVSNGYTKGGKTKPDKSQMWRCPRDVIGPYCILDSFSTFMFYTKILTPCIKKYTTKLFSWFHEEVSVGNVRCLVDNYMTGIFIDKDILLDYRKSLIQTTKQFREKTYEDNKEKIDKINTDLLKKFYDDYSGVIQFKKLPKLGAEPTKFKKNGEISQVWSKWNIKRQEISIQVPEETAQWVRFKSLESRILQAHSIDHICHTDLDEDVRPYLFNLNSSQHKMKLLYSNAEYEIVEPWQDTRKKGLIRFKHSGAELEFSNTGGLPTGKAAVLAVCGKDSSIDLYTREVKKDQFAASTLNKITPQGRIHLPVKAQATLTTRNGGDGGLNLNNLIKDPGFLKAWRVENPATHIIEQIDTTALEPHVLTEASRDSAMLALYGPGAPDNDVYIFGGGLMGGLFGQCFIDEGYDPKNPSKEIINICKKKYKKLRNALKTIILSDDYGSSPLKKWRTLKLQGYDYTYEQIKDAQQRLNSAFLGKKTFGKKLQAERERNNGFFLDGFGFPVAVADDKIKDCTSRFCQRTGHLILLLFLYKMWKSFIEKKIPYDPLIWDYHDETLPIIPIEYADDVRRIYKEILDWINDDFLKATIKLKAEPMIASSVAGIKCEDYLEDDEELRELLEELNGH